MSSKRNPISLYLNCLNCYVNSLNCNVQTLDNISQTRLLLPSVVLADIYFKMSESRPLRQILMEELADLDMFIKLLKYASAKQSMIKCFQALICDGKPIAFELCNKYVCKTQDQFLSPDNSGQTKTVTEAAENQGELLMFVNHGLRLGTFFSEAGCLEESLSVLATVLKLIQQLDKTQFSSVLLELSCLQKVLHAQAAYSCFKDAAQSQILALNLIKSNALGSLPDNQVANSLLANLYQQFSVLHFCRSEYDLSYKWSLKALRYIKQNSPTKIIVDVLRQAAKSCVVKRRFQSASMLIKQAVTRARNAFGIHHQKYADVLLDYGFLLLNVDSIKTSVSIYDEALQIRTNIFGEKNIYVAIAHEDIAYALYVYEYSSGNFDEAKRHVIKAIEIMKDLVPANHLMLASAKRVQALILEEQALDGSASTPLKAKLLEQSEELHQTALQLSLEAFGEVNVQTAKHYGNLGRLYQSMEKYDEAEKMHKKAIKIKTDLLGAYDYEVGLSIGHLASLYNYHMKKHREAEELYLKSIDISLRLFGQTYSGLEYDYRGLCHVYEEIGDIDKYFEYSNILDDWRMLRANNDEDRRNFFVDIKEESTMDVVEEVIRKFFEMCSEPDVSSVS